MFSRNKSPNLTCPSCGKRFSDRNPEVVLPFCCVRCQQIDLGRWFNEDYGLPIEPEIDMDEAGFDSEVN